MPTDVYCHQCRQRHGDVTTPHRYEPGGEVDRVTGERPCRHCGRFRGSHLHQAARIRATLTGEDAAHG